MTRVLNIDDVCHYHGTRLTLSLVGVPSCAECRREAQHGVRERIHRVMPIAPVRLATDPGPTLRGDD